MEKKDKNKDNNIKKFELNKNNLRSLFRILRLTVAIVTIILIVKLFIGLVFTKKVDYKLVYKKNDGNLVTIIKKDEKVNLSKEDSTNDVLYPNNNDRYILFMRNASLYLFDSKKNDVIKITKDVKKYYFSPNDKYVVSTDEEDNLYVYNFNKNEKIVSDIEAVKLVTDKFVIYLKNSILYMHSLNYKKDENIRIEKNFGKDISSIYKDKLIYIDGEKKLKIYDITTKKVTNIDSDVKAYYNDPELDSFYYLSLDSTLYYYDGSKSNKVTSDIYNIANIDVKNKEVVYSKKDGKYDLYFQKSTKEPSPIEKSSSVNIDYAFLFDNKCVYYINKDNDLMYARINGSKVAKSRTVINDVEALSFKKTKDGYIFIADSSKKGLGSLYLAKAYKAKKIDTEVVSTNIRVSKDGKQFFYLKNYSNYVGDLYTSNGGAPKEIDKDVYKYQYINSKNIYYIKDYNSNRKYGDLYKYNKKSTKIDEQVSSIANIYNVYS